MPAIIFRIVPDYKTFDRDFTQLAPAGYVVAIGIRNFSPAVSYTTYPDEWSKRYVERRYGWLDPVMQFSAFGQGAKRWSEVVALKVPVFNNIIMKEAAEFGLNFGAVVVRRDVRNRRERHMLTIARSDREFSDDEMIEAAETFDRLLAALPSWRLPSERQLELLSHFANGLTRKEVAIKLGVSEETVKKDAEAVRRIWHAKNITEAVGLAVARRLINPYELPDW